MAVDHVTIQTPSGPVDVATDHDPVSLADAQLVKLAISADGSLVVIPADAANGLDVDVTRLPALPAGANTIGKVDQGAAGAAAWPVSGTFWQATQPVSGPLTDAQLRASAVPISDVRLPATLKTLPTGADGLPALPVYITSILLLSYDAAARNISTGALTANAAKAVLSIEHALASTKTTKIRRIMVGGLQTAAVAGMVDIQITKGTAASTAGTVVTPNPRKGGDVIPEAVVKSLPTIAAGTVGDIIPWGATAATANTPLPTTLIYDWQEGGETKPLQLRAGVLESIVINVISTAAQALTLTVSIDFTEE